MFLGLEWNFSKRNGYAVFLIILYSFSGTAIPILVRAAVQQVANGDDLKFVAHYLPKNIALIGAKYLNAWVPLEERVTDLFSV